MAVLSWPRVPELLLLSLRNSPRLTNPGYSRCPVESQVWPGPTSRLQQRTSPCAPPLSARPPPLTSKRALLSRHHIVAPSLCVADAAAASVFGAARSRGPIARDVIAKVTQLSHRDGEPPSHRPAGRRRPTGTRRPRGVRRDRQAAGAGRGQSRTVPDAGHPHRRADHQHRGHRPVRSHPRRRRDPDAAGRAGGRPRVALGQRASLPEPLAPAPPAVGRRGRGRCRRQHDRLPRPPEAGLDGRARRAGARRGARAAGVGRVARGCHGRSRAAAGRTPGVRRSPRRACTSTPAKPSATRCRSAGRCIHRPAARAPSPACPPTRNCSAVPASSSRRSATRRCSLRRASSG